MHLQLCVEAKIGSQMSYYALLYDAVDDFIARRGAYRDEHLRLAREAQARGELILAGAFADPADGALLIFQGAGPEVAQSFAHHDPYVKNGLVTKWRVRSWTVVVGNEPRTREIEKTATETA
jgi:hypothetical protein